MLDVHLFSRAAKIIKGAGSWELGALEIFANQLARSRSIGQFLRH